MTFPVTSGAIRRHAADIVTCTRLAASIIMIALPLSSFQFVALYVAAGLSDILDGWIARRTGTESLFGSRLDSAADTFFVAAFMLRVVPGVDMPLHITVWLCLIVLAKAIIAVAGYAVYRRCGLHTELNKISGILLFILPFTVPVVDVMVTGTALCALTTFAAVQEWRLIRTGEPVPALSPR